MIGLGISGALGALTGGALGVFGAEGKVGRGGSFWAARSGSGPFGGESGGRLGMLGAEGAALGGFGAGGSVVGGATGEESFSSCLEIGETPAGAAGGAIAESPFFFKKSNTPKRSPLFQMQFVDKHI